MGGVARDLRGRRRRRSPSPSAAGGSTAGSQPSVANGVAFDREGSGFVADTARGAIWRVAFAGRGA